MTIGTRILGAALAVGVFAACSGGGGNAISRPPLPSFTKTPTLAKVSVTFTIAIPGKSTSAAQRSAKYVGAGTQSATIAVTAAGATAPVSSQTIACTATCTSTLSLDPGSYTFAIALYNGPNATGTVLSSGSASKAIVAGAANAVNLSFTGAVAAVKALISGPTANGPLVNGAPATAQITLEAQDADGNTIVGAYDKAVTLTSSDGVNAPLTVPAVTATPVPGFDSSPAPLPSAQAKAASVTITRSDQQPAIAWNGNGALLYDVIVTTQIAGITATSAASIPVTGGATAPPAVNPGDPVFTPAPPLHPVSPTATPSATPAPTATPVSVQSPVVVPSPAAILPVSTLAAQGNSLFGFIGGTAKTVSLGLGSGVNAEVDQRVGILTQTNFNLSVNGSGLQTFGLRAPRVLNLAATRTTHGHGAHYTEYHPASPLESLHALGRATAARIHTKGFTGTPAVGAAATWTVGSATQAVTLRSIIPVTGSTTPRFLVWTSNTSSVPDSILPTFVQQLKNADTAITAAQGDFHYAPNAPGIQTYSTCNAQGAADGGSGPGTVADPGYVNLVFYDSTAAGAPAGALGFFASSSYSTQPAANCYMGQSDQTPTIWVAYAPGSSLSTQKLNELQGTITHEYSHLVSYVLKSINQAGSYEFGWLLEGLGTFVQDYTNPNALAGQTGPLGAPNTLANFDVQESLALLPTFFAAPQNYTLTGFAALENGQYKAGGATNYGLSYLFLKYVTDRYGYGVIRDLGTSTAKGTANITYAVNRNGGNGITYAQLYSDFVTMLAVSDLGITTDKRYNMQSFHIRNGNYAAQCAGCTAVNLTGPANAATLAAGQNLIVQNMFPGGFAFFNMDSVTASGNTVRIDDTTSGALSLLGALGQK
jgi:hypothetical protein